MVIEGDHDGRCIELISSGHFDGAFFASPSFILERFPGDG